MSNLALSSVLGTLLNRHAETFGQKPALRIWSRRQWTSLSYSDFEHRVSHLAEVLVEKLPPPGTRVLLFFRPDADYFVFVLACLRCGLVPVFIEPRLGFKKLRDGLRAAGPQIAIAGAAVQLWLRLRGFAGKAWSPKRLLGAESVKNLRPPTLSPDAEAAIVYTSGSTGTPKGVIYTHANFTAQLGQMQQFVEPDDVDLPAFPLFALLDLLLGVTAVVPDAYFPPPTKVNIPRVLQALETWKVTKLFAAPALLDRLATAIESGERRPDHLRLVFTAGAPAPVPLLRRMLRLLPSNCRLLSVYGATEALPLALFDAREALASTAAASLGGRGVCLGRPFDGVTIAIEGEFSKAPERVGEIVVSGALVTRAYVENTPAAQRSKFTSDDGKTWHRTGDVGFLDAQGMLWFRGRLSQRVHTQGSVLDAEALEGLFQDHLAVRRTALVEGPDGPAGLPLLWVELKSKTPRWNDVQDELRAIAENHSALLKGLRIHQHPGFPTDLRHQSKIRRDLLAAQAKRLR